MFLLTSEQAKRSCRLDPACQCCYSKKPWCKITTNIHWSWTGNQDSRHSQRSLTHSRSQKLMLSVLPLTQ